MTRALLLHPGSLRSWRDFARECFCFGREAVNTSGEAVRGFDTVVLICYVFMHCLGSFLLQDMLLNHHEFAFEGQDMK